MDILGNVYMADSGNNTIRKVTPDGVVTTLAGLAGTSGSADGTGSAARFSSPQGVAVDSAGDVYVTDLGNSIIRRVTQAGVVTTLAGLAGAVGSADGTGSTARFGGLQSDFYLLPVVIGLAVDDGAQIYVADHLNNTIRKGYPALAITSSGPGFGFSGGQFGFGLNGPAGKAVVVEASPDLSAWTPLQTNNVLSGGTIAFQDLQTHFSFSRFYRLRSAP